jgi:uncharacterized protein (UPF0335 family)
VSGRGGDNGRGNHDRRHHKRSLRKKDPDDRAEEEAILEKYLAALGMK